MNAARKERISELHALAARKRLELVYRGQVKGRWVWDAVDVRSRMIAARNLRGLDAVAAYLDRAGEVVIDRRTA